MGYGGPHAAFFACTDELKRKMPGRLVGLSKGARGEPAYRLALQTREQHIRREKATSNVCTAQALLANMAAMYAVYHGPVGLRRIAGKVHSLTRVLAEQLTKLGFGIKNKNYFDTLTIDVAAAGFGAAHVHAASVQDGINFRRIDDGTIGITLDESVGPLDLTDIINVFYKLKGESTLEPEALDAASRDMQLSAGSVEQPLGSLARSTPFMSQSVFNKHHSETDMLRYMMHLQQKDYSLVHGMIPLGSCTMKLNSTSAMQPLSWKEFGGLHPFAPVDQAKGYEVLIHELERDLSLATGYDATSVQPNSGASGEYAGLKVIQAYHESRGQGHRDVCLIPLSAHGTNPASAAMVGYKVVPIKALQDGSLDLADLREKAEKHKDHLASFMVTYPSTFGVFEEGIEEACQIVHDNGGQVYVDGANCNSLVGLTSLGRVGGDVSHTNLHKVCPQSLPCRTVRRRRGAVDAPLRPQRLGVYAFHMMDPVYTDSTDLLHSPRWWWTGYRPHLVQIPPRSIPPHPLHHPHDRFHPSHRRRLCGPLGQRQYQHHLVGLHQDAGRIGSDRRLQDCVAQCQLYRAPSRAVLQYPIYQQE